MFHRSANSGFENTRDILINLLSKAESFSNEFLNQIRNEYIASCEQSGLYPWRYYYIKYASFRPGSYGILSNRDRTGTPYMISIMQTKSQWSSNTYVPYLKEADDNHLSKASMGQQLEYGNKYVICKNNGYVVCEAETKTVLETWLIQQNENGIDMEDRIVVLKRKIEELKSNANG